MTRASADNEVDPISWDVKVVRLGKLSRTQSVITIVASAIGDFWPRP
jgi:hypothetical protein